MKDTQENSIVEDNVLNKKIQMLYKLIIHLYMYQYI